MNYPYIVIGLIFIAYTLGWMYKLKDIKNERDEFAERAKFWHNRFDVLKDSGSQED